MPDPIPPRNTAPVANVLTDSLTGPPAANNAPAANNGPGGRVATLLRDALDSAGVPKPWEPDAEAVLRDEPVAEKPRELAPETKKTLDRWIGGIFAPGRPAAPPRVLVAPVPVFDPATASRLDDGSQVAPTGRPSLGAPAPGHGVVSPPGLDRGNSVIRWGADNEPSNFPILAQGNTNGCGTTSLAMYLNFLHGGKRTFDRETVDRSIRHYDIFTSPGEITAFARRRGLDTAISTNATPDDLRRMVDQGLPVQVVLDVSEEHDGSGLHYELITGYGTGSDGKPYFELVNPWGNREYMSEEALMARWSNISAKGFPLGLNRVAITMKPRGSAAQLPKNEENDWLDTGATSLRVARGLTQVTSGWARGDGATTTAGAIRLVLGGIAAIPALLGYAGRKASSRYMHEGLDQLKQPGGFWKGLGKTLLGGAGAALCAVPEAIGNVLNRGVDLLASGAYTAVRGIGNWFRKR